MKYLKSCLPKGNVLLKSCLPKGNVLDTTSLLISILIIEVGLLY